MAGSRNEHGFWTALRKRLNEIDHRGHFVRVENSVGPGTPDINYMIPGSHIRRHDRQGWLELKCISHWPRSDVVKIDHYTPEQAMWARARVMAGGVMLLLLKVESTDEYLLLNGEWCSRFLGKVPKEHIWTAAVFTFHGLTTANVKRLLERL